jgi:hypothetical protein
METANASIAAMSATLSIGLDKGLGQEFVMSEISCSISGTANRLPAIMPEVRL